MSDRYLYELEPGELLAYTAAHVDWPKAIAEMLISAEGNCIKACPKNIFTGPKINQFCQILQAASGRPSALKIRLESLPPKKWMEACISSAWGAQTIKNSTGDEIAKLIKIVVMAFYEVFDKDLHNHPEVH